MAKQGETAPGQQEAAIAQIRLEDVKCAPYNPRKMNKTEFEKLKNSIKEFGCVRPLIINKRTGNLVSGHQALKAARELGMESLPALHIDVSEEREKILNIALNRISGAFDDRLLAEALKDISKGNENIFLSGLDEREIRALMETAVKQEADLKDMGAAPKRAMTGDIWKLGEHRLICGDSLDAKNVNRLFAGEKAGMIFTDPPYGVGYGSKQSISSQRGGKKWDMVLNDDKTGKDYAKFISGFLRSSREILKADASIYACSNAKHLIEMQSSFREEGVYFTMPLLIWAKEAPLINWNGYHPQYEVIIYGGEGAKPTGPNSRWFGPRNETDVWKIDRDIGNDYMHPTQKPIKLAHKAISNSSEQGEIIYDPFCGSGSTLMACEMSKRRCYMIELSPQFCDIILKRWEDYTGGKAEKL